MLRTIIILLTCGLLMLVGCNTVKGFGKDMQEGGKKLEQIDKKIKYYYSQFRRSE